MKVSKQEILDILKKNAINEEFAEKIIEEFGKGLGNSLIDILKLLALKTDNLYDDMVVASVEGKARELVDNLDITL